MSGAREGRRPAPALRRQILPGAQRGCPRKRREPAAALRAARRHVGPRSSPAVLGPLLPGGESGRTGDEPRPPLALHDVRKSERTDAPPALRPGLLPGSLRRCRAPGVNPLAHFVEHGARDGRSPHPLFDAKFYLKDAAMRPVSVRIRCCTTSKQGSGSSHDPHPLFQNSFYLGQVPELQHLGITPLQHFVESGVHEGRQPNPLFDPTWYLQTYPDVAMSGQNPLVYYATRGWKEGHDPSPGFSTTYYLKSNGDVKAAGVCPLEHYLRHGRREGRLPRKGATPDDSLVPDAPSPVTLKVRRAHTTPGPLRPDSAAAPPTRSSVSATSSPCPRARATNTGSTACSFACGRSGYRIVLVMSPLSPQTIEDAQWEKLAAAYGNVVHCERDGRVRHRLDECPDVLAPLDGQRYAELCRSAGRSSPDAPHVARAAASRPQFLPRRAHCNARATAESPSGLAR